MKVAETVSYEIMQSPVVVAALKKAGFVFSVPKNKALGIQGSHSVWHIMNKEAGPIYADLDAQGRFFIGFDNSDECGFIVDVHPAECYITQAIYKYHYSVKRDEAYKTACENPTQLNLNILESLIKQAFKPE